jgi:cytochrome P450
LSLPVTTDVTDDAHTPPGPPVVGNVPRLGSDPLRFLVGVQQAYGGQYPLVRLEPSVGTPVTVVVDAAVVHEVLGDRERFGRPALGPQADRRDGLLSSDGQLWETQRSVLEPEFVGGKLAGYADVSGETTADTVAGWPDEGEIDLLAEMSALTMRVITRSLFSTDTDPGVAHEVHEAMEVFGRELELGPADFLLPESVRPGLSEAFLEADELVENVATDFVDDHREAVDPPEDMLTALLEAEADPDTELSENELVDEAVLFMTAGQETTALTITYAFYWLSQNPELRRRVVEEANTVLDGDPPEWGHLSELTLTERVVRETLRLTPAAWNVVREAREPTTLAGHRLEAGELVVTSPYAHHRDRRVWENPETFDPDRWADVSRGTDSYFPFGSGPRVCIGRQIALTEAQFVLAHVLDRYEVDVTNDRLEFRPAVTLQPTERVRARVRRRETGAGTADSGTRAGADD